MTARRDDAVRQVRFISLVFGAICFVATFVLLVWIGIYAGFFRLRLFEPPAYSRNWPQTLWGVVVWGGSFSVSILSSWLCLRYARKFIPRK
jgi:hypothetical protein